MVDRQKVLAVLDSRFPGAGPQQLAAAADAIVELDDDWEEVIGHDEELGFNFSVQCPDICYLADEVRRGAEVRIFLRRKPERS